MLLQRGRLITTAIRLPFFLVVFGVRHALQNENLLTRIQDACYQSVLVAANTTTDEPPETPLRKAWPPFHSIRPRTNEFKPPRANHKKQPENPAIGQHFDTEFHSNSDFQKPITTAEFFDYTGFLGANYAFRNFSIASKPFVSVSIDAAKLRRT